MSAKSVRSRQLMLRWHCLITQVTLMLNTLLRMAVITDSVTSEFTMMSIDTNLNDPHLRINSLKVVTTLMPTRDTTLSSVDIKREEALLLDGLPLPRKQLLLQHPSQLLKKLSRNLSRRLSPSNIINTVMMTVITDLIQKRSMIITSATQSKLITKRLLTTTRNLLLSTTPDLLSTTTTNK